MIVADQLYDLTYCAYDPDIYDGAEDSDTNFLGFGGTPEEAQAEYLLLLEEYFENKKE